MSFAATLDLYSYDKWLRNYYQKEEGKQDIKRVFLLRSYYSLLFQAVPTVSVTVT